MRSPWGDSVIVVAPELDAATRPIFLDRIAAALAPEPTPEIRAATFPDDAVTLDALLAILECGRPRLGRLGPRPSRLRRLLESTVAFVALVAVAPLIVIAGGAIKLDSPGGAFYRQERTGRDGRRFRIWKLRTMVAEAELLKETVGHLNVNDVANFKIPDDPRVTRVGRRLRRFSIDELPQLWNVVRGEMRLVGPRPTALPASAHEPWQTARLDVDPGITGLWQVTGRGTSTFVERCRLDIRYVRRRSCWLDLRLLVRTIPSALGRRGVT